MLWSAKNNARQHDVLTCYSKPPAKLSSFPLFTLLPEHYFVEVEGISYGTTFAFQPCTENISAYLKVAKAAVKCRGCFVAARGNREAYSVHHHDRSST